MQAPIKQLFKHTRDYQELKQSKANFILTKLINLFKIRGITDLLTPVYTITLQNTILYRNYSSST